MKDNLDLEEYLSNGIENIVKEALKASLSNSRESLFMAKYAIASRKSSKLRRDAETRGDHVPPFLIASITSLCNLHCAGCYSRALDACTDGEPVEQMAAEDWGKVFREAADIGISFILLAGGEPLIRTDVINEASKVPEIIFPTITNGTLLQGDYLSLFDQHRNLVPILSIEGDESATDHRRGKGIYAVLDRTMDNLNKKGILFGVSITVTTANMNMVTSAEFVEDLYRKGCKVLIYVEYVPAEENTEYLAPDDEARELIAENLAAIKRTYDDMICLCFPGDERSTGGCLAAGRGFFHINSHGGAEPCPFSPYSDCNVRDIGVVGALHSGLFQSLKDNDILNQDHNGACVLFAEKDKIENIMSSK